MSYYTIYPTFQHFGKIAFWCEGTVARQREKSGGCLIYHSRGTRIRDDGRDKEGREERRVA